MPVVLGRDGRTHLTTFADGSAALCGEPVAETSARIGDMAVTHDDCLALEARRRTEAHRATVVSIRPGTGIAYDRPGYPRKDRHAPSV